MLRWRNPICRSSNLEIWNEGGVETWKKKLKRTIIKKKKKRETGNQPRKFHQKKGEKKTKWIISFDCQISNPLSTTNVAPKKRKIHRNWEKFCLKPINTRELEEIGIQIHPYREGIECLYCRLELRGRDEGTVSGRGYILVLLPRSAITFVPVIMCWRFPR